MDKDYDSTINDIFRRHPSVQVSGFGPLSYKAGIESMAGFDRSLGSPWRKYPCFHVAGTNGKGTVCSMIAASLAASGARVGLYTSPHLLDFRERIKIVDADGFGMIPREDVMNFIEAAQERIGSLSFFEITTGMALQWFAAQKVDFAVVEVGLGGRLDSTNVITPAVSVVTSIGLDHCALLGDTREKIALEKAGIFKKGVPAVVWGHDPQTDAVFESRSAQVGCPLHFADESEDGAAWVADDPRVREDCRTAVAALRAASLAPSIEGLAHYAALTGLRARWERCTYRGCEVICDIGHNPAALSGNFSILTGYGRPLVVVFGIMADKDLRGISEYMPSDARYILCAPDTARALNVGDLQRQMHLLRPDLELKAADSVKEALAMAAALCAESDNALIYLGGSTFVVAEALTELCTTN